MPNPPPRSAGADAKAAPAALVTGAGRGIGRAIAVALARAGYSLCIAARSRAELEETRRLTGLPNERALIVLIDLAETDAPEDLYAAAREHFASIDVLVNNAGWAPPRTPLGRTARADIDRILAVNLRAPIALTRLAAPAMAQRSAGAIINVASSAAHEAAAGEAVYAAAKAGLIVFTRACFKEFRQSGVKLSVIAPGLADTAFIPHNKRLAREAMLSPEDVAAAVVQILHAPANSCPVEMALEPQRDPMRRD